MSGLASGLVQIGMSEVRALPYGIAAKTQWPLLKVVFGPSEVCTSPLGIAVRTNILHRLKAWKNIRIPTKQKNWAPLATDFIYF